MTFLLDTHALLWILFQPDKLSDTVTAEIKNIENDVFVSPITFGKYR